MSGMPIQPGVMDYSQFNPMGGGPTLPQPSLAQPGMGGFSSTPGGYTAPGYTNTPSATAWSMPAASTLGADFNKVDPYKPISNTMPASFGTPVNIQGGQILGSTYPVTQVGTPNYGMPAAADLYSAQATGGDPNAAALLGNMGNLGNTGTTTQGFDMSAVAGAAPAPIPMPQQQQAVAFGGGGCCSAQDDGTHAHGQLNLMA